LSVRRPWTPFLYQSLPGSFEKYWLSARGLYQKAACTGSHQAPAPRPPTWARGMGLPVARSRTVPAIGLVGFAGCSKVGP
jgi:hypothetical protein